MKIICQLLNVDTLLADVDTRMVYIMLGKGGGSAGINPESVVMNDLHAKTGTRI